MGKWKRFLNILLTAVICFAMGLVQGKRVCAGVVQACEDALSQGEFSQESKNSREIWNHYENELSLQNRAVMRYDSGTGSFRENVFYRTQGPGDRRAPCFEDSG